MINIKTETKTKIIDKGANNLFRQLEIMGKDTVITAGIEEKNGSKLPMYKGEVDGEVPIAQYAYWQEEGTKKIPPRPFLKQTVSKRKKEFLNTTSTLMRNLSRGGSAPMLLEKQAMEITKWIKATIWTLSEPVNAPSTIRDKRRRGRGSRPLLDSKSMRDAVTSTVHLSKGPKDRKLRRIVNKINKDIMRMTP